MADKLAIEAPVVMTFYRLSNQLKQSINDQFWIDEEGHYGYFIRGTGKREGVLDPSFEAMGHAFAVDFDIANERQAEQILDLVGEKKTPILSITPPFKSIFTDDMPGRHNNIVWPFINGYWASVAAKRGRQVCFINETEHIARLIQASGGNFYEIYDGITGQVNGGWQCGYQWASCSHQTWSATAYIRAVLEGIAGIRFFKDGIHFAPTVSASWGDVQLSKFIYRDMELTVRLEGCGNVIKVFAVDGIPTKEPLISSDLRGKHCVDIYLGTCDNHKPL